MNDVDILRRQLLWRASRRGIREMDLLVGGFAAKHLSSMSIDELEDFARILELPDQDLWAWATKTETVPAQVASPLLTAILNFRPEADQS